MLGPTVILLIFYGLLSGLPHALAYRPFVSTDAAVAETKEMEIELGVLTLSRQSSEKVFSAPGLRLNYGFTKDYEFVGEFTVDQIDDSGTSGFNRRRTEIRDAGFFLKGVVNEGAFRSGSGWVPTIAFEVGPLFPSREEEKQIGVEGIVIGSGWVGPVVYHLNLGGLLDKGNSDPGLIWGLILEYPFRAPLRAVFEINGEDIGNRAPEHSSLLGLICRTPWRGVALDVAGRRRLTESGPDWLVTAGATFAFAVPF